MAAGYGMHFTEAEAREIVERWRAANPWAAQSPTRSAAGLDHRPI
jgi:hypothetical protein